MLIFGILFQSIGFICALNEAAPGILTFTIKSIDVPDGCYSFDDHCRFRMDVCVGSGKSFNEKCIWLPKSSFNGSISLSFRPNPIFLVTVDNIKALYFLNANVTTMLPEGQTSTVNFGSIVQHMGNAPFKTHIYGTQYTMMLLEVSIQCEQGFYPAYNCSKRCFAKLKIYDCDQKGNKICHTGYVFSAEHDDCLKNRCLDHRDYCANDGHCVNTVVSIRCICADKFSGVDCRSWDPCRTHRCQNDAICSPLNRALSDERSYLCICKGSRHHGRFCENMEDTSDEFLCKAGRCPHGLKCDFNLGKCTLGGADSMSSSIAVTTSTSAVVKAPTRRRANVTLAVFPRQESIRLSGKIIQTPFQNTYTIAAVSIVILVFIIGIFTVSYWILKIKYFQKKSSLGGYCSGQLPPSLPPISRGPHGSGAMDRAHLSSYLNADECASFRRCHSLDGSSLHIYGGPYNNNHLQQQQSTTAASVALCDSSLPRGCTQSPSARMSGLYQCGSVGPRHYSHGAVPDDAGETNDYLVLQRDV